MTQNHRNVLFKVKTQKYKRILFLSHSHLKTDAFQSIKNVHINTADGEYQISLFCFLYKPMPYKWFPEQ